MRRVCVVEERPVAAHVLLLAGPERVPIVQQSISSALILMSLCSRRRVVARFIMQACHQEPLKGQLVP
jgi:hypothetical protein